MLQALMIVWRLAFWEQAADLEDSLGVFGQRRIMPAMQSVSLSRTV